MQPKLLASLDALDFPKLDPAQQLALLRAWELAVVRMGVPEGDVRARLLAKTEPLFPAASNELNRELSQLLVALGSPRVVSRTLQLMATAKDENISFAGDALLARNANYALAFAKAADSRPNHQQILYAYALRTAKTGWTPETHRAFFAWFPRTAKWNGGNSFRGFLENMRKEALENVTDPAERLALDTLSSKKETAVAANVIVPKGPGRAYAIDEVLTLAKDGLRGRNFETGKAMFSAVLCATCHRFNGEGGSVGPDLTGAGNRYTLRDLLENIIDPSKVISDQYQSTELETADGNSVIGRITVEENGKLFVATNPFAPSETVPVNAADVKSRHAYPVSLMPPGLINGLNAGELLDLLAYIQAGGNPQDKAFATK